MFPLMVDLATEPAASEGRTRPSWEVPMPNLATERAHLRLAERHIVEGKERIARQADLVAEKQERKQDGSEAEALLQNFHEPREIRTSPRDQNQSTNTT